MVHRGHWSLAGTQHRAVAQREGERAEARDETRGRKSAVAVLDTTSVVSKVTSVHAAQLVCDGAVMWWIVWKLLLAVRT